MCDLLTYSFQRPFIEQRVFTMLCQLTLLLFSVYVDQNFNNTFHLSNFGVMIDLPVIALIGVLLQILCALGNP